MQCLRSAAAICCWIEIGRLGALVRVIAARDQRDTVRCGGIPSRMHYPTPTGSASVYAVGQHTRARSLGRRFDSSAQLRPANGMSPCIPRLSVSSGGELFGVGTRARSPSSKCILHRYQALLYSCIYAHRRASDVRRPARSGIGGTSIFGVTAAARSSSRSRAR
ncbi:hypothetical protein C8Q73DRAFT_671603 [Cubamyces lactineus]|nr:hypothetical protein C8Q73DRAFT_671603 [Cubamyces lactineus]